MRKTITWEGEEKVPGIIVEKGALGWDKDQPIPVCWSFQHDKVFGLARDLYREDDGRITAEIELFKDTEEQRQANTVVDNGDVPLTVYVTNLVQSKDAKTGKQHVFAGTIRSVNMVIPGTVGWD